MRWTVRRTAIVAAALIVAGFLVLHVGGGRDEVGVLSGTLPASDAAGAVGLLYVAAWFGFVLVAPILILAVALDGLAALVLGQAGCGSIAARVRGWLGSHRR